MTRKLFFLILFIPIIFISCASTNVYEKSDEYLFQGDEVISIENKLYKDGKLKKHSIENLETPDTKSEEDMTIVKIDEKAVVYSKTNGGYVAYSFLGKPFIILGCSIWELLKSCGYAFLNIGSGARAAQGYKSKIYFPDTKGKLAKAKYYNEQNKITAYPEYHKPFTDNKITVSKVSYAAQTVKVAENEMQVASNETYEIDNTLSVKKSVMADAYATAGVMGVIGAIITMPISVISYIVGAAGYGATHH